MMDAGGRGGLVQSQGVNPDCPNAANPFHRCAEYCPVPGRKAAAATKPSPPRPGTTAVARAAQNGTKHGDGAARVVPVPPPVAGSAEDGGETKEARVVNPGYAYPSAASKTSPPRPGPGHGHAAQNGTAGYHDEEEKEQGEITVVGDSEEEEGEITVVRDSEEARESVEDYGKEEEEVGACRRRTPSRSPATDREAGGERTQHAVNPDCPNAANPFHRCAEYCPVSVPRGVAKAPPTQPRVYEGSTHSDPGDLHPRPRHRDKGGGSGGLPLYVFLREGSDGDGKKVDPRCPNAPNPFHVCTDHCLAKIAEAGRSSEGAKSPISLFSRHSRRSSSSSEEGSVKSAGSKKVDPKCPNAANPFHQCSEHCAAKMQQAEQQQPKGAKLKSPRTKVGKNVTLIPNWKVDPRCPNASNPFHMCAQYCFDHLNESAQTSATKSDKKKGKGISKEERGEINPDCANGSNPYHKCGDHCKRKGDR